MIKFFITSIFLLSGIFTTNFKSEDTINSFANHPPKLIGLDHVSGDLYQSYKEDTRIVFVPVFDDDHHLDEMDVDWLIIFYHNDFTIPLYYQHITWGVEEFSFKVFAAPGYYDILCWHWRNEEAIFAGPRFYGLP